MKKYALNMLSEFKKFQIKKNRNLVIKVLETSK